MTEDLECEARKHPIISEFVDLVDSSVDNGIPSFDLIQSKPFMKFWQHFIIHRWDDEKQDFYTVLYGSHICYMNSHDYTGYYMADMNFGEAEDFVRSMNKECLDTRKRIFNSNSLFWKNEKHRVFHQVKMPLIRNEAINEVLVCMSFD